MVEPFPLEQVRLLDGPFQEAMEINRQWLHSLPSDPLLHTFRLTAGLASSAEPLGGWEKPDCELRGHFAGGHYLSACALTYASTGDETPKDKANTLVAELAKCQQALGNGYLSVFPVEEFDRLREGRRVWAPFYTYHKIMTGLLDMYLYCGNEQALDVAEAMAGLGAPASILWRGSSRSASNVCRSAPLIRVRVCHSSRYTSCQASATRFTGR